MAWIALLAIYVVLGLVVKSAVLNWIVGPIFPLVCLYLLPKVFGRAKPDASGDAP